MAERLVTASYAADEDLLAELRAAWPPAADSAAPDDGYLGDDLAGNLPSAAIGIGDRFALALVPQPDGSFIARSLARDEVLVTHWRAARPGDGLSSFVAGVPMAAERAIDVDQTNTSVVVGERAIVKWFRRVGPAPSRAATLVAHLDEAGFAEIPSPLGMVTWARPDGPDLTLAQGDALLPGARDGWDWCVERVRDGEPSAEQTGRQLGGLVARLHGALVHPTSVLVEPRAIAGAADVVAWHEAALATLGDALRLTEGDAGAQLRAWQSPMRAELDGILGAGSVALQPVHGDLHVGQILEWAGGLAVIDFDGNPALGEPGNAIRQPVERDLAQMLMSLDHVGRIVERERRQEEGAWIADARAAFLGALERAPDPALLAAFEVEQECRELVYAARFLPRWRYAPMGALRARYGR